MIENLVALLVYKLFLCIWSKEMNSKIWFNEVLIKKNMHLWAVLKSN